jgi:hypothetical protein
MDKYDYEIWDNSDSKLRYTILSDDGLVWVCDDGYEPVFIGLLGPREKQLGEMLPYEHWPPSLCDWIRNRISQ